MSERIAYEDLKIRLESIPKLKEQAFLCLTYAGLARVGEIVKNRVGYNDNPPLKKEDILVIHTKQKLYIHILTEKINIERKVPVSFKPRDILGEKPWGEDWLCKPILSWRAECPRDELFPYSTRWGEKVFQKHFPQFNQHIHLLRGWRASHLLTGAITGQPINRQIVARMGGWRTVSILDRHYDNTVIEDYEEQI